MLINVNVSLPKEMNEFIKFGCLAVTKETNVYFIRTLLSTTGYITHSGACEVFGVLFKLVTTKSSEGHCVALCYNSVDINMYIRSILPHVRKPEQKVKWFCQYVTLDGNT